MLRLHALLLSLVALGGAQEPWEFNSLRPNPDPRETRGTPDAGPATYFLDRTCRQQGGRHDLESVLREVQQMATEGFDKLSKNFEDFAKVYERIFKVKPNDDAELKNTKALRVFHRISGMVPAGSFEDADIRLYCDNDISDQDEGAVDPRWVRCPDNMHHLGPAGNGVLNSQLDFSQQIYMDQFNGIYRRIGSSGVQDIDSEAGSEDSDDGITTLAQTYRIIIHMPRWAPQNSFRETMTVGDLAFEYTTPTLGTITGEELITMKMDDLESIQVMTLFHELCHSHHLLGTVLTGRDELHGWQDLLKASRDVAVEAADAYAFLGLYAVLLARNIQLKDHPSSDLIQLNPFHSPIRMKRSCLDESLQNKVQGMPFGIEFQEKRAVSFIS